MPFVEGLLRIRYAPQTTEDAAREKKRGRFGQPRS